MVITSFLKRVPDTFKDPPETTFSFGKKSFKMVNESPCSKLQGIKAV